MILMERVQSEALIVILAVGIFAAGTAVFAASSDSFPWSNYSPNGSDDLSLQEPSNKVSTGSVFGFTSQNTESSPASSVLFTPGAANASSNTAPRSGVQLGDVAAGSSVSNAGVAQGNIDATQSGPGAAGLFTPASPGNAAALQTQVEGALQGGPIVNGTGANVRVTVPEASPSMSPVYKQFTGSEITGSMGTTNSSQVFGGQLFGGSSRTATTQQGGTGPAAFSVQSQPLSKPAPAALSRSFRPVALPRHSPYLSSPLTLGEDSGSDALSLLGAYKGSMTIDNIIYLYGSNGTLSWDKQHGGTLKLAGGRELRVADPHHSIEKLAAQSR